MLGLRNQRCGSAPKSRAMRSFGAWSTLFASVVMSTLPIAQANGQCTTTITTFPYTEGFETGPAWTSGGANSDWAWGAPAHPTINSAAEGNNAWCVGGLTGSFYTNGQQSWLETPCFDLSTLDYPYISFQIYWETEPDYDGVGLQYSPNEGVTWINVGEEGDADCINVNWFNSTNITALNLASPRQGWSGTAISGGCANGQGSGGWVLAAHCLDDLPTDEPVKFRFIFGAGTICNSFDGAAIDDVYIGEAPPEEPSFQYQCFNDVISVNEIESCATSWLWDFGDPASGASNTSTLAELDHTYSAPGQYTLTLTLYYDCQAPQEVQSIINILDLEITTVDAGCNGVGGSATATVSGGAGPYNYLWNPGGYDTATVTDLAPGIYVMNVNTPGSCPAGGTLTIGEPPDAVVVTTEHTDATCNGASDGTITLDISGGLPDYEVSWSPQGGSATVLTGLPAGTYTYTVLDAAGCSVVEEVEIAEPVALTTIPPAELTVCSGQEVTLVAAATGGTAPYAFEWVPEGPVLTPETTTVISVQVIDANGCTGATEEVAVTVTPVIQPSFSVDIDRGCVPLCVTFTDESTATGARSWSFSDGGTAGDEPAPVHCFTEPGVFDATLIIADPAGCTGTLTLPQIVEVLAVPVASIGVSPAVALIDDPTFQFTDRSLGAALWSWSFGDPAASTSTERAPSFTYAAVGCYAVELEVANDAGCSSSASTEVCVEDAFALYAPNAFSPNADGINDSFGVSTTVDDPAFFALTIYDRWGSIIHTSDAPFTFWDGEGVPQGVYIWQVRLRDSQNKLQERKGHVTLIR